MVNRGVRLNVVAHCSGCVLGHVGGCVLPATKTPVHALGYNWEQCLAAYWACDWLRTGHTTSS